MESLDQTQEALDAGEFLWRRCTPGLGSPCLSYNESGVVDKDIVDKNPVHGGAVPRQEATQQV